MAVHRRLQRTVLRGVVPATLVVALGVAGGLSFADPTIAPIAATAPAAVGGQGVDQLIPAPPLPERVIPELPLPTPEPEPEPDSSVGAVVYTCEPWADARLDDPAHPNHITNKDCPEINAAKERAQREYLEQLDSGADEVSGDGLEGECSDPNSSYYGTVACGADLDGDGVMDGTTD